MKMLEIYNKPLAILSESFSFFEEIAIKITDEKAINTDTKFERAGNFLDVKNPNGIAILNILGPIISKGNWWTAYFGIPDTETLAKEFVDAQNDPTVKQIILNIDSPGGMVTGINEFANIIKQSKKPVSAYVGGTAASAAYWIASAADSITIDATARVGGIGVVIGFRKPDGKTIEIVNTASPMKRIDIESDAGKAAIIAEADAIADVFISSVASNRKITKEKVVNDFGKGGVHVGENAVKFGLADNIGALNNIILGIETKLQRSYLMENITSTKQLAAAFPDLVTAIREESIASIGLDGKIDTARKEASAQEKERILGLVKVHFGDAGKSFADVVESGVNADQLQKIQAAIGAKQIESGDKQKRLDAIMQTGAPNDIKSCDTSQKPFAQIIKDYQAKGMKYAEALAKAIKEEPEAHKLFIAQANEGRA